MDKDASGPNIQDHYLGQARKGRSWLTVVLNSGKKIGGRVVSFDRYTVLLEDHGQEQMVFKHAIATISVTRSFSNAPGMEKARPPRDRGAGPAPAAGSPSEDKRPSQATGATDKPEHTD